jgi:uridine phosphorylase
MVAGVLVNRTNREIPDKSVHEQVEANAVAVVVEAARRLAG